MLFNYINDLRLMGVGKAKFKEYDAMLKDFKSILDNKLGDNGKYINEIDALDIPYFCMEKSVDHNKLDRFFREVSSRMSRQGWRMKEIVNRHFWLQTEMIIRSVYLKHFNGEVQFKTIGKK